MTPEATQLLIDRLDENLTGAPNADLIRLLDENPEAAHEWNYLNLAVDAIQQEGIYAQVSAVRTSMKTSEALPAGAVVRSMFRKYSLRAAAIILIISTSASLYKYLSVSSQSLYDRYYTGFDLNTSRGADAAQPIIKAYDAKDWTTVLAQSAAAKNKDNQTEFLAGMADLELKKYDDAISHFEEIIAVNSHAGSDYYQDEAEYYLAISWLAHKNVNEAMPILEKIRANAHHQYHDKVAKMSFFDLRLAQYKENK
jgi:tetratricopeptide (TPR) repeat protein